MAVADPRLIGMDALPVQFVSLPPANEVWGKVIFSVAKLNYRDTLLTGHDAWSNRFE